MEQRERQCRDIVDVERAPFGARPAPTRPPFGRVPDVIPWVLQKAIGAFHDVSLESIFLGGSVEELVNHITATLAWAGRVMAPVDADVAYQVAAESARGSFAYVDPATADFSDDCALVCVVNPSNDSGELLDEPSLCEILQRVPPTTPIILDESYIQYAQDIRESASVALMRRFANLIVLRTFCNAYGRGGSRVAYALACADCVALLESRRSQFLMSSEAQSAAVRELLERERLLAAVG